MRQAAPSLPQAVAPKRRNRPVPMPGRKARRPLAGGNRSCHVGWTTCKPGTSRAPRARVGCALRAGGPTSGTEETLSDGAARTRRQGVENGGRRTDRFVAEPNGTPPVDGGTLTDPANHTLCSRLRGGRSTSASGAGWQPLTRAGPGGTT